MSPAAIRRRGNAAVELAMMAPVLATLLVGMLEFGLLGLRHMAITGAVRAGVEYAFQYDDTEGVTRAVQAAAGTGEAVSVSSARFCECAGAPVTCGGGLCASGLAQQVFIRVTAQETYTPIFLTNDMIHSLLGTAAVVSKTATFRVE